LIRPTVELAVAFNEAVRQQDEWFEEPDDHTRLERALASIVAIESPIDAAAVIASRIARAQAFGEGHKRTALLLARWTLDRNGIDGARILPADDRAVAELLVQAAAGRDVEQQLLELVRSRAKE
jgi:prophage maintenance system killer protein